jgi:hypothetical protein
LNSVNKVYQTTIFHEYLCPFCVFFVTLNTQAKVEIMTEKECLKHSKLNELIYSESSKRIN